MRPVIELRLNFQGDQDKFGQPFFKDEIVVEITNAGAVPVVLQDVIVEWKHSDAVGLLSSHINSFAGVVLAPGVKRLGVLHALHNGAPPTVKPLGAFADFVRVQVKCSDIGRLAPLAFQFQQATGLTLPSADKLIS